MNNEQIFSVSDLTSNIKGLLETHFAFIGVTGEISNLHKPASGHYYFTLKDKKSQLKTVFFKFQQRYMRELPVEGMKVICRGRISVYEPRGDYQFIIDSFEPCGAGELQLAFEKLKTQLQAEGLFDQEKKKKLPFLPKHITLVTSPRGAAIHDFIKVAHERCQAVPLSVYPVSVQGAGSAKEIIRAIQRINKKLSSDIIVLCRGGGSLEDLWTFNEEPLVRAVYKSNIPVVSAIGHEVDSTLVDFASDCRAPTPSAAAEILIPDSRVLRKQIKTLQQRLARVVTNRIDNHENSIRDQKRILGNLQQLFSHFLLRLDHASMSLNNNFTMQLQMRQTLVDTCSKEIKSKNPIARLKFGHQQLVNLKYRLQQGMKMTCTSKQTAFNKTTVLLDAVSPLSTLARGYSIAQTIRPIKTITHSSQVDVGDKIRITLFKGKMNCEVKNIVSDEKS